MPLGLHMFSSPRKDDHPDNHAPQEAKHDAEQASKNDASPRTASNSGKAPESERRQDAPGSSSPLQPSPRQDSRGSDSASQSASQNDATSPRGAENAKAKREESKDSGSSLPGIHEHQNHNDEAAAVQRVSLIKAQLEAEQAQKLATEAPPKMVTKASTVPTLMSTAVNHSPWGLPPKPAEGFHTYGFDAEGKPIINDSHRETIDQHVEDYFHQSHSRRKNFKQSFNDRGYFHNLQGHWATAQLRAGQAKEKAIGLWNSGTALVQEHIPAINEALKGCTSKCHSGKETEDYDDKHGATHVY